MANLREAVKLTRRYSSFFSFPLTDDILFRFLISDKKYSRSSLKRYSKPLKASEKKLLSDCFHTSRIKLQKAGSLIHFLSNVPTISLIAITGSLAVNNARRDDDIDLMVVVSPDTLWLTRPFIVILLKLLRLRRVSSSNRHHSPVVANKICDNLWLDETSLALPLKKRNLYTAHEVLQALPIFDRGGIYQRFIRQNAWTKNYLANAYQYANSKFPSPMTGEGGTPQSEGGEVLKFFNKLAFKLQYRYMKKKITNETVSLHSAYFHPRNLSHELERHLEARK